MAASLPASANNPINQAFSAPNNSPLLPMVGQVLPAAVATRPNFRSFPINARGFIVQQLTLGGTNPNTYLVGVNRQPYCTFVVRDAFVSELLINTVEIYNASTTTELDIIGVSFKGLYTPSANSISTISGIGNGLFAPLASSVATLAALTTVGMAPGTIIEYVDSTTLALVVWQLTLNAASPITGAGITVPVDYNAATNPYVWIQV